MGSVLRLSLFALVIFWLASDLEARRGASSYRGFSRSSSWGGTSGGAARTWGSRSAATSTPSRAASGWGASSASPTSSAGSLGSAGGRSAFSSRAARTGSRASNANYYQQARRNNTVFSDRQQASQAFEQRYRSSYPNRFPQQPSSRPNYIPESTTLPGGQAAPLFYNQNVGGYGYRDPLTGGFMLYSVFRDALMLDLLMGRNNYYYGAPPPATAATGDRGFLKLALWLLLIFAAVPIISRMMRRAGR